MKKIISVIAIALLASCGIPPRPSPETKAPVSSGPSSPPAISQPTTPSPK